MQKIRWMDDHWARIEGGQGTVEVVDGSIYLTISLRNVGSGLAVSFGWSVRAGALAQRWPTPIRRLSHADCGTSTSARRHWLLAGRHPRRR